jgi:hypothetical protein
MAGKNDVARRRFCLPSVRLESNFVLGAILVWSSRLCIVGIIVLLALTHIILLLSIFQRFFQRVNEKV